MEGCVWLAEEGKVSETRVKEREEKVKRKVWHGRPGQRGEERQGEEPNGKKR